MAIVITAGQGSGIGTPDCATLGAIQTAVAALSPFSDDVEVQFKWASSANEFADTTTFSTNGINFNGHTLTFKPFAGQGMADQGARALRYDNTKGACLSLAFPAEIHHAASNTGHFIIQGLQITHTNGFVGYLSAATGSGTYSLIGNLIDCAADFIDLTFYAGTNNLDRNVFIVRGSWGNAKQAFHLTGVCTLRRNTIVRLGGTPSVPAIDNEFVTSIAFTGNVIAGFSGDCRSEGTLTGSHNATDQASGNLPSTNRQTSLVMADEFVDVTTGGSHDLRIDNTSSTKLLNLGTATGLLDIFGQANSGTQDIGAFEYQSGGGGGDSLLKPPMVRLQPVVAQ